MNEDSRSEGPIDIGAGGLSRRGFLGVSALGLGGALLSPPPASAAEGGSRRRHPRERLLLKDGIVLTLDRGSRDFDEADVLIEGGKIKEVAPEIRAREAEMVDASGMIVMPGFVDTHRHMWQGLVRNIGPDDLLLDYLNKILFGVALQMTPDDVYLGDLVTALSAMNAGITTILDWSHIANTSEHTDAAIQALGDAHIRAVYGYGPSFGLTPPWFQDPNSAYPDDIRRLRKQFFSSSDQLLTLALAAAGPEFSTVDAAVREWTIAREVGARISVHVGVGAGGRLGRLGQLAGRVPLGDDTTYIHACTLSNDEWDKIADSGGTVSLAIPIEMQMGHGMPPIQKALDRKIRPSLSVDVETNQPTDMFTQMRACFALQRAFINEEHLFPDVTHRERLLTVRDVLELATVEGARANGLAGKIGTLTPGKEADVILLRTNQINVAPLNTAVGGVVLGMDSSNVDSVFIAGRAIKRNGRLVGVNVHRLQRDAEAARDALVRRAGVAAAAGSKASLRA